MPFCPMCRTEHEDQFEQCPVCQAGLVDSLPAESDTSQDVQLKPLAQFSNVSEAELIREILETNAVRTIQVGETDPIGIASGAEPVTLLVEERCLPRARELYEAYYAGSDVAQPQPDEE